MHTVESLFFEPPKETTIGLKNRVVRKIGGNLQCSTEERETTFGSSYREVRKIEGPRNRERAVVTMLCRLKSTIKGFPAVAIDRVLESHRAMRKIFSFSMQKKRILRCTLSSTE